MSDEKVVAVYDPIRTGDYFKMKYSLAATLEDLKEEFFFFTHALLFAVTKLVDDPVFDFLSSLRQPVTPVRLEFDKPVFSGLETRFSKRLNHTLFAIPKDLAGQLEHYLGQVCVIDTKGGNFWQVIAQDIPIADPLALSKASVLPSICPMVVVTVFAIDSMLWSKGIQPATNPPINLPTVLTTDPDPNTVLRGQMFLGSSGATLTRNHNETFLSALEKMSNENSHRTPE